MFFIFLKYYKYFFLYITNLINNTIYISTIYISTIYISKTIHFSYKITYLFMIKLN